MVIIYGGDDDGDDDDDDDDDGDDGDGDEILQKYTTNCQPMHILLQNY